MWCAITTYDQTKRAFTAEFKSDKHLHAERLDGCYLLKSSRQDLSRDELWRMYILLAPFRDMKSPLAGRRSVTISRVVPGDLTQPPSAISVRSICKVAATISAPRLLRSGPFD